MDVILLERVARLGQMGETVKVKDGFARNFLLPRGKALRASEANKKKFESQRELLEERNAELKRDANRVHDKLDGQKFTIIRQAGETGHLYGSVSSRDIAEVIAAGKNKVTRNQVALQQPIKMIGMHPVTIQLHPEVESHITVNVARSPEEAERQARGEEINVVEESTMDDLGLEVGAALDDAGYGDR